MILLYVGISSPPLIRTIYLLHIAYLESFANLIHLYIVHFAHSISHKLPLLHFPAPIHYIFSTFYVMHYFLCTFHPIHCLFWTFHLLHCLFEPFISYIAFLNLSSPTLPLLNVPSQCVWGHCRHLPSPSLLLWNLQSPINCLFCTFHLHKLPLLHLPSLMHIALTHLSLVPSPEPSMVMCVLCQ